MTGTDASHGHASCDYQALFNSIVQRISTQDSFQDILPIIEQDLLRLLRAERLTIYQRLRNEQEIVSKFKSGNEIKEIRLPLSPASIAGYVALNHATLLIRDVYDSGELQAIHPCLRFNAGFDRQTGFRSRSMVVVPIHHKNVGLGVLQLLNCTSGTVFSEVDLRNAQKIGMIIGRQFSYEFHGTNGPYDYLILKNRISRERLSELQKRAAAEQVSLTHLLVSDAGLRPEEVGYSLEQFHQVPYMAYDPEIMPALHLVDGVSEQYLRNNNWLPLSGDHQEVVILIDDPTDSQRIQEIQKIIPADRYIMRIGLPEDIQRYLRHDLDKSSEAGISDLVDRLEEEGGELEREDHLEDALSENTATVIILVKKLIQEAHRQNASDIHIEPEGANAAAQVRYRVDGLCHQTLKIPASHVRAVIARIKVMSGLDIAERRKPQDGKCLVRLGGKPLELRVVTLPTVHGESAVLRLLSASEAMPLNRLSLSSTNHERILDIVARPHGIFLVVGPTGSGKTTTLHAVLGHINQPDRKIWTAEDPVEITQPGLQQVQVHSKIGLTFASALRSFLRADPDVIMIGEMRDSETAQIGIEASLTGHLVFSTLHTNSAPETLVRLLDLGVEPVSFADALLGVLAQRLLRTLCGKCKIPYQASEEEIRFIRRHYGEDCLHELPLTAEPLILYRAYGCKACGDSGYKGRMGVHELLVGTEEIRSMVSSNATAQALRTQAMSQGMRTLMQDGIQKVLQGFSDFEQLRRIAG
ncbi:Type II secretory pathway ATPase GspE/PulE or T4P pilus assembly pathway ATPase PilB [Desulfonatronum thiosulfatophilum]|uniref:Type II secretory pathway ATPase GspE/PulE or T4P pilus assembly pathway ATPase PilB n=1 Tax=Desulfonatronum thiosulfatophilum TaxID=617002 RepID=A0A1G6BZJ3_9BACT|nr:GspE/PulE family protein [Desulfonatronum thiosulfatophilum]SDB26053.1 Type II secretory pathway ATPase GspE/PulE or T4P pilus assembly pathway ATPase PilB [Desulfonatronum thiosulfatophilum]